MALFGKNEEEIVISDIPETEAETETETQETPKPKKTRKKRVKKAPAPAQAPEAKGPTTMATAQITTTELERMFKIYRIHTANINDMSVDEKAELAETYQFDRYDPQEVAAIMKYITESDEIVRSEIGTCNSSSDWQERAGNDGALTVITPTTFTYTMGTFENATLETVGDVVSAEGMYMIGGYFSSSLGNDSTATLQNFTGCDNSTLRGKLGGYDFWGIVVDTACMGDPNFESKAVLKIEKGQPGEVITFSNVVAHKVTVV